MLIDNFGFFKIINDGDNFIYAVPSINDGETLGNLVFDKLFTNEFLFRHFKYLVKTPFEPTEENFVILYNNLVKFIDSEPVSIIYDDDISQEMKIIIEYEDNYFSKNKIRKDKIGKIGELILNLILENSSDFICVTDKFRLISSQNMSVYGIDTIHYSRKNHVLLFGESKLTSCISNGVALISDSLQKYDSRIKDEIKLRFLGDQISLLNLPDERFRDALRKSFSPQDFINLSKTEEIWIPLFIAHGKETDNDSILSYLKSIPRNNFLGLSTKYLVISMPLFDADLFVRTISKKIIQRCAELKGK